MGEEGEVNDRVDVRLATDLNSDAGGGSEGILRIIILDWSSTKVKTSRVTDTSQR